MKNLVWNVIYHNVNRDELGVWNVFDHGRFREDVSKELKKCKTKEEFAEKLRGDLFYYYCSKCEWEVLVSPWCGSKKEPTIKIDVYWQVMNNWEIFLDYVWNSKRKKNGGERKEV